MKEPVLACVFLAIIIGLGTFIRVDAALETMWLDECHTAWVVDTDSMSTVTQRAAIGNQPPLYFWLVWGVTKILGLTEFSLRLVSIISGSLLMLVASHWSWKLSGRWAAAILVAGLLAFDGQFIYYAAEARSYALVQLLGLIQAIFFWRLVKGEYFDNSDESSTSNNGLTSLVIWTLLSIAVLNCHYTSIWLLASEAFILTVLAILQRKVSLRFLLSGVTVAAAFLAGWSNISLVMERSSNWDSVSSTRTLWNDVEPWLVHWILIPFGFSFAACLFSIIQQADDSTNDCERRFLSLWIAVWAIIGPVGIAIADNYEFAPMALVRYSSICWVAMSLFAATCLKRYSKALSWIVVAVILLSSFFGNWWYQELVAGRTLPHFRNEDWVTPIEQLAEANSNQPVFQLADVIEDVDALTIEDRNFQQYLKFPILGASAVGGTSIAEDTVYVQPTWNYHFPEEQRDSIRDAGGCWLIVRGNFDYALMIPEGLELYLQQKIEFKFIPNPDMEFSEVFLIQVRLVPEKALSEAE